MRFSLLKWYVDYQLRSVRQLRHLSFSGSHVREAGVLPTTRTELGEAGNPPKQVSAKSTYRRVVHGKQSTDSDTGQYYGQYGQYPLSLSRTGWAISVAMKLFNHHLGGAGLMELTLVEWLAQ